MNKQEPNNLELTIHAILYSINSVNIVKY